MLELRWGRENWIFAVVHIKEEFGHEFLTKYTLRMQLKEVIAIQMGGRRYSWEFEYRVHRSPEIYVPFLLAAGSNSDFRWTG